MNCKNIWRKNWNSSFAIQHETKQNILPRKHPVGKPRKLEMVLNRLHCGHTQFNQQLFNVMT